MSRSLFFILTVGLASCGKVPSPSGDISPPNGPDVDRLKLDSIKLSQQSSQTDKPADLIENPEYHRWNKFPVGTTVTRRMVTDSAKTEGKTITTFIIKLKSKTDDDLTVETQAKTEYSDGRVMDNPPLTSRVPRRIMLPEGIDKAQWGKLIGNAEETLTVLGKSYKCVRNESTGTTDAGKLLQTVWSSEEMPGVLVKSLTLVPAVEETTTIDVVELVIPRD